MQPRTLLIIDDSETNQTLYKRAFKGRSDILLKSIGTAEEGLSECLEVKPDLVIVDFSLPGMDGLVFLKRIQAICDFPIPVIVVTEEGNETLPARALKKGAADYLIKHVDGRHLRLLPVVVDQVLKEAESRKVRLEAEYALEKQRALTDAIVDTTAALIFVVDRMGRITRFNRQCEAVTGYLSEEVLGREAWELLIPEDDRNMVRHAFANLLDGCYPTQHQNHWRTKSGELRMIRWENNVLQDGSGQVEFVIGTGVDITEAMEAENKQQIAANVFYNVTEGILVTTTDGDIVSVNPAACQILGYSTDELIGQNPRIFKSGRHAPSFYADLWQTICCQGMWSGDVWNRRKNGEICLCRETITAIRDGRGVVQNYIAVFRDITEIKQQEEFIRHQAYHDALTDLPNRSLFLDRLRYAISVAKRERNKAAFLFIDLDRFKDVNDELGHDTGDLLLIEVARRIVTCVREMDTVARLGGDEFTVILNELGRAEDAVPVCEKILAHLSQPTKIKDHDIQVSGCIGVAIYPDDGDDMRLLMAKGDTAMYRVKQEGGNGYFFAGKL